MILGHSLGTLNTLYALNQLTKAEKDEMVELAILAGPPYLGSTNAVRDIVGGDPSYTEKIIKWNIGINLKNQKLIEGTIPSTAEIFPKNTMFENENSNWMKTIM